MGDADLQPLGPAGAAEDAVAAMAGLGLRDGCPDGRPRLAAVMIAAPDGRASVNGRSGGLGSPADRAFLRESRAVADALLVGTTTLRAERYGNVLDPVHIEQRRAAGLSDAPPVVTICRDLRRLPVEEARIFAEDGAPVVVFTESAADEVPDPQVAAALTVVRGARLTPAAVMRRLYEDGARLVVTEGGPTLLRLFLGAGLVDDILLTVAPFLVAGGGPTLIDGTELDPPVGLGLSHLARAGDHLFAHYEVTR